MLTEYIIIGKMTNAECDICGRVRDLNVINNPIKLKLEKLCKICTPKELIKDE